jgi:hypothetical protein
VYVKRRSVFAIVCLLVPSTANAGEQGDEQRCATSAECGSLKCIHERCRDPADVERIDHHTRTLGWTAMFNGGHGYQMTILAGDLAAACVVPALAVLAFTGVNGSLNGYFAVAAAFPTTLTGPIIHIVHGRAVPAVISFFGWVSVAWTAVGMNVVGQVLACCGGATNGVVAGMPAFGIAAAAGTALMTTLDVFMARGVQARDIPITPTITPVASGALLMVHGLW